MVDGDHRRRHTLEGLCSRGSLSLYPGSLFRSYVEPAYQHRDFAAVLRAVALLPRGSRVQVAGCTGSLDTIERKIRFDELVGHCRRNELTCCRNPTSGSPETDLVSRFDVCL